MVVSQGANRPSRRGTHALFIFVVNLKNARTQIDSDNVAALWVDLYAYDVQLAATAEKLEERDRSQGSSFLRQRV
jgi:hypothetical protein